MLEILRTAAKARREALYADTDDACPHPAKLVNMSRLLLATKSDYQNLAWHLLGCFKCAQRWELLQSDPHLHPFEIWAVANDRLPSGEEGMLLRMRANLHLDRCESCHAKVAWIERGFAAGRQVIEQWLMPKLIEVHRESRREDGLIIEALVLDEQERPRLTEAGGLARTRVSLTVARDHQDSLAIDVHGIPEAFHRARLILLGEQRLVRLSWSQVAHGNATFSLPDVTDGIDGNIHLSEQDIGVFLQAKLDTD